MIFQRFYNGKKKKKNGRKDTFVEPSNEIINHVQQVTENHPLVGLEFACLITGY